MTDPKLETVAERSGFRSTGRTGEVERLCEAFAHEWQDAVRCIEYGRSAEGRPMLALLASRADPLKVPVLMIQGGIHPGESDGKDAGFITLREILQGTEAPGVLDHIAILFVPAFNVDGHERFARWNRPNQRGPEETGWRATAQNLNLNRDYMKADAPEMQAMLGLIREWDPIVCADIHVTDGADFEPDISLQAEPINQGDPALHESGRELRDQLIDKLTALGSLPLPFYPDLAETDNPASGFLLTVYSPRFSTGYFPQRNRFTVLVETHSWKDYAHRIRVTRNTIISLAELVVAHGSRWEVEAHVADERSSRIGGSDVTLDYSSGWREPTQAPGATPAAQDAEMIEFRGYAYTREPSAISGALVTVYDPTTPQIWRVPYRNRVEPSLIVRAPLGGYVVPSGFAKEIGAKLALHGITFQPISEDFDGVRAEVFRATSVAFSPVPFEGRMRATLSGNWIRETHDIAAGALFVPISQPLSRLLMALLEPRAPDSLASWGFFNACFEQKEHIEPYVAEQIARDMIQAQPQLRTEFERRLAEDAAFAGDPNARLNFFLSRHSSWDDRYNLYPVLRVDELLASADSNA
ncbi:MAG TPA: M14 family metallopeptidase [Steroidobacteraceae bacterium]|nr:M14 family metallopeptidase [Steroidobacteraceae bacterium]